MQGVVLVPCECPTIDELTAISWKLVIDPTKYPDGIPLHSSPELLVKGLWIQNPDTNSLTIWLGYATAFDSGPCHRIIPGADKFIGVISEAEKLVAVPRERIRPFRWKINSTAAVNASVLLFL